MQIGLIAMLRVSWFIEEMSNLSDEFLQGSSGLSSESEGFYGGSDTSISPYDSSFEQNTTNFGLDATYCLPQTTFCPQRLATNDSQSVYTGAFSQEQEQNALHFQPEPFTDSHNASDLPDMRRPSYPQLGTDMNIFTQQYTSPICQSTFNPWSNSIDIAQTTSNSVTSPTPTYMLPLSQIPSNASRSSNPPTLPNAFIPLSTSVPSSAYMTPSIYDVLSDISNQIVLNSAQSSSDQRIDGRREQRKLSAPYARPNARFDTAPTATSGPVIGFFTQGIVDADEPSRCIAIDEVPRTPDSTSTSPSPSANPASQLHPLYAPMNLVPVACQFPGCTDSEPLIGLKAWKQHVQKIHHIPTATEPGGICECCGEYVKSSLLRHVVTKHSGVAMKCRLCLRVLRNVRPDVLKKHLRTRRHAIDHADVHAVYYDELQTWN
ncbi:hypothetical protein BDN70DRAFT_949741 [Pholiota conissans]|uniref:Uncharacterized protein n=1 Tax=Pholiota conissans TaxID=109636 RepID=A0A9P5YW20_9AGAR|nr:hypothetical protein BDN70DRAFT_949741 [Pholiota conissans]